MLEDVEAEDAIEGVLAEAEPRDVLVARAACADGAGRQAVAQILTADQAAIAFRKVFRQRRDLLGEVDRFGPRDATPDGLGAQAQAVVEPAAWTHQALAPVDVDAVRILAVVGESPGPGADPAVAGQSALPARSQPFLQPSLHESS